MEAPISPPPPVEPSSGRQGCARNALMGCGIAALLVLAVIVGFLLYARRNPGVMTDLMMKQIESHWGPDVTDEEKADLRVAYADFRKALTENRVNREGVGKIQVNLSANRSNQLSREQVRQLTRAFREAASAAPPVSTPGARVTAIPSPSP